MCFICSLCCGKNRSLKTLELFLQLALPQIPPSEVTRSFTPSMEFTLSFVVSIRITFLKELPSHNIAARGANKAKCSCGHNPARNSSFLEYSLISVSPGLKLGIMFQGKCDKAVWPVPLELVAEVGPDPIGSSPSPGILDHRLPEANGLSGFHLQPR